MKYQSSLKNKLKLFRKRPAHRTRIFFKYLFHREEKEPVFLIATRRSGSNLLLSYLNSVPGVSFGSEILNQSMFYGLRSHFISKAAVLRHIAHSVNDYEHRICGAKFLKVQLATHRLSLEDLKKRFPRARFIILYRQSVLDQFVSLKIAEKTGVWIWKDPASAPLPPSIRLEVGEFMNFCRVIQAFYEDLFRKEWLKDCSVTMTYEELIADPQKVFDEMLFPFLNLSPVPVQSNLKKQNTKALEDVVENGEDLRRLSGLFHAPGKFSPQAVFELAANRSL